MIKVLISIIFCLSTTNLIAQEEQPGSLHANPKLPALDNRCIDPLQYTKNIILARQGDIVRQALVDDLMQAELDGRMNEYPYYVVAEMFRIIDMVYEYSSNVNSVEGVDAIFQKVNKWCSDGLPPAKLEDRRFFDEDGDGFPDYDANGDRIIILQV